MFRFCFCFQIHCQQLCLMLWNHSLWFQTCLVSEVSWKISGKSGVLLIKQRKVNNIADMFFRCLQSRLSLKILEVLLHFSLRCHGQFRNWEKNIRNKNLCCHIPTCHDSAMLWQGVIFGKQPMTSGNNECFPTSFLSGRNQVWEWGRCKYIV